ncbi:MAG TPA: hypothetical protein VF491_09855 [Vicinamibacterales bacterium]
MRLPAGQVTSDQLCTHDDFDRDARTGRRVALLATLNIGVGSQVDPDLTVAASHIISVLLRVKPLNAN